MNRGFLPYSMGTEREHELLTQSRKVRREFSLSRSFTEQLSLLIIFFIGKNLACLLFFWGLWYCIILLFYISTLYCNVLTLLKQIIIFLPEKTTSEIICSESPKIIFYLALTFYGKSESAAFQKKKKKITLHLLEFLTRATVTLYYINPQRINKHLNQSRLNKL